MLCFKVSTCLSVVMINFANFNRITDKREGGFIQYLFYK
jgi:hypothetical protein